MEPPVGRLKRRPEFLRVAAGRSKWAAPGLVLQARRRDPEASVPEGIDAIRVGFTVSRKVGGAVARNRARRRLRAAAECVMAADGQPGVDYVVIGRQATLSRPFDALIGDLRTAIGRLRGENRTKGPKARTRVETQAR